MGYLEVFFFFFACDVSKITIALDGYIVDSPFTFCVSFLAQGQDYPLWHVKTGGEDVKSNSGSQRLWIA